MTAMLLKLFLLNRVIGQVFGPKRKAVNGDWRKFRKEDLDNSYSS
jgi:hypothetical protein